MRRLLPIVLVAGLLLAGPAAMAGESHFYRGQTEQGKPISLKVKKTPTGWLLKRLEFRFRCEWTDGSHLHEPYLGGVENDTPYVPHGFAAKLLSSPHDTGYIIGFPRRAHSTGQLQMKLTEAISTDSCDTGNISWRARAARHLAPATG